jgi:hypothetical protein
VSKAITTRDTSGEASDSQVSLITTSQLRWDVVKKRWTLGFRGRNLTLHLLSNGVFLLNRVLKLHGLFLWR